MTKQELLDKLDDIYGIVNDDPDDIEYNGQMIKNLLGSSMTNFRATKAGVQICPFFMWTSENIEGLGHSENDVNLVYCTHPDNEDQYEGNCQEKYCPLLGVS